MGVQMVQPRANHLAAEIANGGKQQGPHQRSDNIQRQENARRQAAGADQQGPITRKPYIKRVPMTNSHGRCWIIRCALRIRAFDWRNGAGCVPEAATDQIE